MRKAPTLTAVLALAVAGCGGSSSRGEPATPAATQNAPARSPHTATTSDAIYFGGDIAGYYRQRPSFIHVTSDENIKQIRWASWGGNTASASGTMFFQASDRLLPAPLKLKLKNIHKCSKRFVYLRLVVTSVSGAPFWALHKINYTCRSPFL
jgi:hypothetical protein